LNWRNFEDLEKLSHASINDLLEIEGIGPNIAMAILDWFKRDPNIQLLEKLRKAGVWPVERKEKQKSEKQATLADKTFVITGTLESYSRDEIKDMIQELGGKVTDSGGKTRATCW
jgi:DNA ligase (NAD+)